MNRGEGVCFEKRPPHLSAPEISHCPSYMALVWHPGPVRILAPDCILDPSHSPPVPPFTTLQMASPCSRKPWSVLTKTLKPSDICGLRPPQLGCMRERRTLLTLLHECWSRSPPNLLPVFMFLLLHNSRHPCPCTDHPE